jgi:hypothetical protein
MANIEEQIDKMSEKDRERLEELLVDVLYSKEWCEIHNISYVDPDIQSIQRAREEVYKQFFEKKYLEKKNQLNQ